MPRSWLLLLVFLLAPVAFACGRRDEACECCGTTVTISRGEDCAIGVCDPYCLAPPDGGPVDAGPGPDSGGMVSPEEQALLGALFQGSAAAAAIGGPLVPAGEQLRDDTRVEMAGTREMAARDRVEAGISGDSVVTDGTCTTYSWSGLSVTVTFDMCVLEVTMLPLDGSITLRVAFFPTELVASFGALTVGDLSVDGEIGVRTGGNCPTGEDACALCPDADPTCAEMRAAQQTLWADLTLMTTEMFSLVLDNVTVMSDATATVVDGAGSVGSSTANASFDATALRWATGDCLPTSGSVVVTPTGGTAFTVEATSTTPSTGVVMVTIPPFPAVPVEIAEPCL